MNTSIFEVSNLAKAPGFSGNSARYTRTLSEIFYEPAKGSLMKFSYAGTSEEAKEVFNKSVNKPILCTNTVQVLDHYVKGTFKTESVKVNFFI